MILLGICVFLVSKRSPGSFRSSLLWLLKIPFGFAFIGQLLFQFPWCLAFRRGFEYDYEKAGTSWYEKGKRVTYRWQPPDRTPE